MTVTLENLAQFADEFVAALPQTPGTVAHVVGLRGELGAGKTTFVQHVARALKAPPGVTSPTFVFAQRYAIQHPAFTSLIHIDAYRLKPEEAHTIGLSDFLKDPKNLVVIEWPENIGADFPQGAPVLTFSVVSETERTIDYA